MNHVLLATDLDDTLVGDDDATYRLNEILNLLRKNEDLKLVYVTGRSLELFNELQNEKSLLIPDALITAIGTEVYIDGENIIDWPNVEGWDMGSMKAVLAQYPSLTLQAVTEQRKYKLSYFLKDDEQLAKQIRETLKDYPIDVSYSMGLYLDILPRGINKGSALKFLAEKWVIEPANIFACGDSGNDISMLSNSNAIIVGNAKSELLDWADIQSRYVYRAQGDYANGIIEGLSFYQIIK